MVEIECKSILGNLRLAPVAISEVPQGEMQSSDEMVFVVAMDAKFNMSQESILTGNKAQLLLLLYIMECYGVLCEGKKV